MSAPKRARTSLGGFRVVLDVGGTKFPTTRATLERSTYLAGMIDSSVWDADQDHTEEIFIDRDPEIFASLLRLMRQVPLVAGLLPHDREKFAVLLAEADFFGFDLLLDHVKAKAFYNARDEQEEKREEVPSWVAQRPEGYDAATDMEQREMRKQALIRHREAHKVVSTAFETKDEEYGSRRFSVLFGSIGDALGSGMLPSAYFSPPEPTTRVVQILPVEATTWFLIGDAYDDRATVVEGARFENGQSDHMKAMREIVQCPAMVRRVACHALMENEKRKQWLEPMLYLEAEDLEGA